MSKNKKRYELYNSYLFSHEKYCSKCLVKYLSVVTIKSEYGCEFFDMALLDENKEDLGIDIDAINGDDLPIESELSTELGEFLSDKYETEIELYLN